MTLRPKTWLIWLVAAMTYCILTYNPLYQILLLSTLISIAIRFRRPLKTYITVAAVMSLIPLLVNTFLVHSGKTVVYEIPTQTTLFSFKIPVLLVGGPLTLESMLMGLITSIFLLNMLTAFHTFNSMISPDDLTSIIPSRLPNLSMTASITLRFIPTLLDDYKSIKDAQISRGVRIDSGSQFERIRNQLSIIVPTIVTSLERGFSLAESMASRGYSRTRTRFSIENTTASDRILHLTYLIGIAITLFGSYSGVLTYWPYDSLTLPQISLTALIPLILIALPGLIKNEPNNKAF